MAGLLVSDVMQAVRLLEGSEQAAKAADELGDADFVAVLPFSHGSLAIADADQIRTAPKDATLADLFSEASVPPPVLAADVPLDAAVKRLAGSFVADPSLVGALVESEPGAWAVVPRSVFVERAAELTTRGGGDRLEGAPIDVLVFECPEDHERKVVAYYNPSAPPRCSSGHPMTLVD